MNLPEDIGDEKPKPARRKYTRQQWLLFAAGFFLWYLANGLVWYALYASSQSNQIYFYYPACVLPINILIMVILLIKPSSRPVALGILVAIVVNLLITLVLGMFTNAVCFLPFFINTN